MNSYTCIFEKESTTFADFLKRCATAFIAQYHDQPMDAPLPTKLDFDKILLKDIQTREAKLQKLQSYTEAEWIFHAEEARVEHTLDIDPDVELRKRFTNMLQQVEAWEVPAELIDLKIFMKGQLERSIEWHTPCRVYKSVPIDFEKFKQHALSEAQLNLNMAKNKWEQHVKQIEQSNTWLAALHGQLK